MTRDEYLMAIHGKRVEMTSYAFRRGLSYTAAEEAVDRALAHIEARLESFMASYSPVAALVLTINTKARDLRNHQRLHEDVARELRAEQARVHDDLEDLQRDVRAAFATLPALIQWVAWKVYVDGCTWSFIAEQLGEAESTIKKRVGRALHSLRPRLRAYAPTVQEAAA